MEGDCFLLLTAGGGSYLRPAGPPRPPANGGWQRRLAQRIPAAPPERAPVASSGRARIDLGRSRGTAAARELTER